VPTVDITSSLVLYGATVNVDTVMVDGVLVKQGGQMIGMDDARILDDAQEVTMEIWDDLFRDRPELEKRVKG
jgi:hypothetical protein